METIGAIIACAVAGILGYSAGTRWAPSPFVGALMGMPVGALVAPAYFVLALVVGNVQPHLLDAHLIGLLSLALVIAGAVCGAIGAWFGYRKSLGASLF